MREENQVEKGKCEGTCAGGNGPSHRSLNPCALWPAGDKFKTNRRGIMRSSQREWAVTDVLVNSGQAPLASTPQRDAREKRARNLRKVLLTLLSPQREALLEVAPRPPVCVLPTRSQRAPVCDILPQWLRGKSTLNATAVRSVAGAWRGERR